MSSEKEKVFLEAALFSSRKRESKLTGFLHGHPHQETKETVPLYENFCFALTLFRLKTAESVSEAKELLSKLLYFQLPSGMFPLYLHEYPRSFSLSSSLKIGTVLFYILKFFKAILGEELKTLSERSLSKIVETPATSPFWESRRQALFGKKPLPIDCEGLSPELWTEWVITMQLSGENSFPLPIDPVTQRFLPLIRYESQEGFEPKPHVLDQGDLLKKDHFEKIQLGVLFPFEWTFLDLKETGGVRIFWKGSFFHNFFLEKKSFFLLEEFDSQKKDLFEVAAYVNRSSETKILINGAQGTFFSLGDNIEIVTPEKSISFRFEKISGEGDFTGHIFPGNRPCQTLKGFEAYDWKIALRTLRRSNDVQIDCIID